MSPKLEEIDDLIKRIQEFNSDELIDEDFEYEDWLDEEEDD